MFDCGEQKKMKSWVCAVLAAFAGLALILTSCTGQNNVPTADVSSRVTPGSSVTQSTPTGNSDASQGTSDAALATTDQPSEERTPDLVVTAGSPDNPSPEPTSSTAEATMEPTADATSGPTEAPASTPDTKATEKPTTAPTVKPGTLVVATTKPTAAPTARPTVKPTVKPTTPATPKPVVTAKPTATPTAKPQATATPRPSGAQPTPHQVEFDFQDEDHTVWLVWEMPNEDGTWNRSYVPDMWTDPGGWWHIDGPEKRGRIHLFNGGRMEPVDMDYWVQYAKEVVVKLGYEVFSDEEAAAICNEDFLPFGEEFIDELAQYRNDLLQGTSSHVRTVERNDPALHFSWEDPMRIHAETGNIKRVIDEELEALFLLDFGNGQPLEKVYIWYDQIGFNWYELYFGF